MASATPDLRLPPQLTQVYICTYPRSDGQAQLTRGWLVTPREGRPSRH